MKKYLILLICLLLLSYVAWGKVKADPLEEALKAGHKDAASFIFNTHGCGSCHTLKTGVPFTEKGMKQFKSGMG